MKQISHRIIWTTVLWAVYSGLSSRNHLSVRTAGISPRHSFQISFMSSRPYDSTTTSETNINSNAKVDARKGAELSRRKRPQNQRRFIVGEKEIVISCVVTALSNPSSTRLVPPMVWLTSSGSRVKIVHFVKDSPYYAPQQQSSQSQQSYNTFSNAENDTSTSNPNTQRNSNNNIFSASYNVKSSILEIFVPRPQVDASLSVLRMNGFQKQDLYRMLDKGPWILAFVINSPLVKLLDDLKCLGLDSSQRVHVVSHCPYLLAQYCQYRGRDVAATADALRDVGYSSQYLTDDVMRFPTILAAPPGRIRGWLALLQAYGIARQKGTFGKLMRRAPFMFYSDPPQLFDVCMNPAEPTYKSLRRMAEAVRKQQEKEGSAIDTSAVVTATVTILNTTASTNSAGSSPNSSAAVSDLTSASVRKKQPITIPPPVTPPGFRVPSSTVSSTFDQVKSISSAASISKPPSTDSTEPESSQSDPTTSNIRPSVTGDGFVFEEIVDVLNVLTGYRVADIDKIVRSQPCVLLESAAEVRARLDFLLDLCVEHTTHGYNSDNNRFGVNNALSATFTSRGSTVDSNPYMSDTAVDRAVQAMNSLILAYPAVMAIPHRSLSSVSNQLRSEGLRKNELMTLIRGFPFVFRVEPENIQFVTSFLRFYCGFRKIELAHYLLKYPSILAATSDQLNQRVEYLCEDLGADPTLLKKFPAYLSFDLDEHIRLRAEFLQAVGFAPLEFGLDFLVFSTPSEFSKKARVDLKLFDNFKKLYFRKIEESMKERASQNQNNAAVTTTDRPTAEGVASEWRDNLRNALDGELSSRRDDFESKLTSSFWSYNASRPRKGVASDNTDEYVTVYDSAFNSAGSNDSRSRSSSSSTSGVGSEFTSGTSTRPLSGSIGSFTEAFNRISGSGTRNRGSDKGAEGAVDILFELSEDFPAR